MSDLPYSEVDPLFRSNLTGRSDALVKRECSDIGEQTLTSLFGSRHFLGNKKGLGGLYPESYG